MVWGEKRSQPMEKCSSMTIALKEFDGSAQLRAVPGSVPEVRRVLSKFRQHTKRYILEIY